MKEESNDKAAAEASAKADIDYFITEVSHVAAILQNYIQQAQWQTEKENSPGMK